MPQENVELARQALDAINRRDRAALLALCDPELEWVPIPEWPENRTIRGGEAVWDFLVGLEEAWEEGFYELGEVVDVANDKFVGRVTRHLRGKTSGIDTEFDYWAVVTLRDGKQLRSEWFGDRAEALQAAGLSE